MRETKEFSALSWIPFQTHQDQENLWKSGPGELQCFVSTKATATADSSDGKPLWFISFVKFSSRTEAPQPNPDTGPPPAPSAPFKPPPEKLENVAPNPLSFSTSFKGKNGLYNWTYPTTTMPVIIIPVATGILGGGGNQHYIPKSFYNISFTALTTHSSPGIREKPTNHFEMWTHPRRIEGCCEMPQPKNVVVYLPFVRFIEVKTLTTVDIETSWQSLQLELINWSITQSQTSIKHFYPFQTSIL